MRQKVIRKFIGNVQKTEIDIRVEKGKITKNYAKGTTGSIAFIFTDIYAKLMIGIFGKNSTLEDVVSVMDKIQASATTNVKEYFEKRNGSKNTLSKDVL